MTLAGEHFCCAMRPSDLIVVDLDAREQAGIA
jgi:hypothetical protein